MRILHALSIFVLVLPNVAFAQTPGTFGEMVNFFLGIFNLIIPVIFALTFLVIIWGITKGWIIDAGSEAGADRGKQIAFAGIVGLIVMTGMWGIIALAQSVIKF